MAADSFFRRADSDVAGPPREMGAEQYPAAKALSPQSDG
jgi:hypothetical protein